ncbi:MAG TPA: GerMN domain-containing protein [Candidatus Corynebacterium avicola]|uniref:Lipoprotein LpqB n=1 Tax=Candidatus Corynebacterium avicola TaxID=2838527 RepID=A0A9D1UKS4_9CORY|nr:GerMN domain-containing protein [Candidatus Corynebacterium avicola]
MTRRFLTRTGTRTGTRTVTTAVMVPLLLTPLAACTTLPGSSTPEAVSSYAPVPDADDLPGPDDSQDPYQMLRDFYLAATHPGSNREAAKEFLSSDAEDNWVDGESTMILDQLDINATSAVSGDTLTYMVRGTIIGQLGTGGVFRPESTPYEEEIELTRHGDGWRIDSLPDGVVMDRADFQSTYQARNLYFLDPTRSFLVPDRRWVYSQQENIGFSLVSLLGWGPRDTMAEASESAFPEADGVKTSVDEDGTFTVELTGVAELSAGDREALAAQIIWTLAEADIRGPYRILADGVAMTEEGREDWTVRDVADFAPSGEERTLTQAVQNGSILSIEDGVAEPIAGWTGQNVAWASTSARTERIAAVTNDGDDRQELLVGKPEEEPETLTSAGNLTRPSWTGDGSSLYVVADGQRVRKYVSAGTDSDPEEIHVDASELDSLGMRGSRMSVFNVSRDGTRAVVLINRRMFIVPIIEETQDSEDSGDSGESGDSDNTTTVKLGTPTEIGQRLGDTVQDVDWREDGTLLVGTNDQDAPAWVVSSDGSEAVQLSSRNVTPPVVRVAAAGSTMYVLDDRAVMQLDLDDSDSRFWREVSSLQGSRAIPIVPN